jgi:DNA-binding CsgD family transcriptional regulator/tetratricopeptide (TPR) repeat protein
VTVSAAVRQGRDAIARRAWAAAFRALVKADRERALDPQDLEHLALAAYMLGRTEDHLEYLKRAHRAYQDAGDLPHAARCAFWAGINLATRGRASHAAGWFGRAQRLADRGPRDNVEHGYLLIPVLLERAGERDWKGVADVATKAERIAQRHRDADLFALAAHERGHALVRMGRVEEGLRLLDEVMVSVTAGELSPVATGLAYCSVIAYCQDLFQVGRAQAWTQALTGWCEQQPEMVAHAGQCLVHRAELMQLRGEWRGALQEARRVTARFAQAMNTSAVGHALYRQGEVYRLQGRFDQAEAAFREAARSGYEPQPGLALLRHAQGKTPAAVSAIRRALAETTDSARRARLLPACVEIFLADRNLEQAREICSELEDSAKGRNSSLLDALAAEYRGAVELAQGKADAAPGRLRHAYEAWRQLEAPYEAARVRVLIAQACRMLGDEEAAALELDAARGAFFHLRAEPDVARVDTLVRRAVTGPEHGLTRRELEVLRHVAAGRPNKTIARDLGVSNRTVDRHLSNIFDKLGVSSRSAATAYAYRNRLV